MVNLSLPVLNAGRKGHRHPGAVKTMGGVKLAFSDQNWNISRVLGFGREHLQSAVLILELCIELRVKRVQGTGVVWQSSKTHAWCTGSSEAGEES